MQERRYRIFISSPGDVADERQAAVRVIHAVAATMPGMKLECFLSEQIPYSAELGPQDAIPLSSEYDLVLCLFWTRLGTELPARFDAIDSDGQHRSRTGTEYEFEIAVQAAKTSAELGVAKPAILAYRKTAKMPPMEPNAKAAADAQQQLLILEEFWQRWFKNQQGHYVGTAYKFANGADFEQKFERHLRYWINQQHSQASWDVAINGSPFRGLEFFDAKHAEIFFGRERAIDQAVYQLDAADEAGFAALWIVGCSGSGKSSLMRAGMVPRLLATQNVCALVSRPSDWGKDWAKGFVSGLTKILPELLGGSFDQIEAIAKLCKSNAELASEVLRQALRSHSRSKFKDASHIEFRLLIALDQAEELLIQFSVQDRQEFSALLRAWVQAELCILVVTLRSDFYAAYQQDGLLTPLKTRARQLDLGAPSPAELTSMIEGPCEAAGLSLQITEDGASLREELSKDCLGSDSLPMLQFALDRLFEQRIGNELSLSAYLAMGRAAGALGTHANQILAKQKPEVVKALDPLLLALINQQTIDGKSQSSARVCPAHTLPPAAHELAQQLLAARILTAPSIDGQKHFRVSHESLLQHWRPARELIEREKRLLENRQRFESELNAWQKADKKQKSGLLLESAALEQAKELLAKKLINDDQGFVAASVQKAGKTKTNLVIGVVALMLALIMATGAFWFAGLQRDEAQKSLTQLNISNAEKQNLIEKTGAAAKTRIEKALITENRTELFTALKQAILLPTSYQTESMHAAAIAMQSAASPPLMNYFETSALGKSVVSDNAEMIVWWRDNLLYWQNINDVNHGWLALIDATSSITSAAVSGDSAKLFVTSDKGTVLMNLDFVSQKRQRLIMRGGHSARFSKDTTKVAVLRDGTIATLDFWSGTQTCELEFADEKIHSFHFIDDYRIAVNFYFGEGVLINVDKCKRLGPTGVRTENLKFQRTQYVAGTDNVIFYGNIDTITPTTYGLPFGVKVNDTALSPDQTYFVATSNDGVLRKWQPKKLDPIAEVKAHAAAAFAVGVSSDGRLIATGGDDGFVTIWSSLTLKQIESFECFCKVRQLSFTSSTRSLVALDIDGRVWIWNVSGRVPQPDVFRHTKAMLSFRLQQNSADDNSRPVSFNDAQTQALTMAGSSLEVWDLRSHKSIRAMLLPQFVRDAAILSDGRVVAALETGEVAFVEPTAMTFSSIKTELKSLIDMDHCDAKQKFVAVDLNGGLKEFAFDGTQALWTKDFGFPLAWVSYHEDCSKIVAVSLGGRTLIITPEKSEWLELQVKTDGLTIYSIQDQGSSKWITKNADTLMVASEGTGEAYIVNLKSHLVQDIFLAGDSVKSASLSQDGKRATFSTVFGTTKYLRSGNDIVELATTMADRSQVSAFSSNDVIATDLQHRIALWEAKSGKLIGMLRFPFDDLKFLQFSERSNWLAATLVNGSGLIWDIDVDFLRTQDSKVTNQLMSLLAPDYKDASTSALPKLRQELFAINGLTDQVKHLMTWHFTAPSQRTISPFSEVLIEEFITSEIEWLQTQVMVREMGSEILVDPKIAENLYRLDPGHPLVLLGVAAFEKNPETVKLYTQITLQRLLEAGKTNYATLAAKFFLKNFRDKVAATEAAKIAITFAPENKEAADVLLEARNAR